MSKPSSFMTIVAAPFYLTVLGAAFGVIEKFMTKQQTKHFLAYLFLYGICALMGVLGKV